ncbi:FAD-binding protein, partial [Psychrobacter urativorans]
MITALCSDSTAQNISTDADLSQLNTMALACVADTAVLLHTETQLDQFMARYTVNNQAAQSLFVLSGGSNVLLPDRLNAIVLRPLMTGITVLHSNAEYVDIEVMAGENWHDLVVYTVDKGWYGLENLALIPGLTGAAPVQ